MNKTKLREEMAEMNRRFVDGLLSAPMGEPATIPQTKEQAQKQYVQQVLFPLTPLEGGEE